MKSKRSLMTVLVGLAMLATPIVAAAKDHNHDGANNPRPAQARAFVAPARSFVPARVATRVGTVNEYRNQGPVFHRDWVDNHPGWNRGYGYGPGYYANRGYYNPGYVVAPVAPYYAAPGYAGYAGNGSCAAARHFMIVYQQDRATGHPAAAADVLRNHQWAFRSGCGVPPVVGGGGLFNGFGGLRNGFGGVPAYNNYGGGYGQPYGGYNGGYGQPYGGGSAILAPLLQNFVH